MLVTRDREGAGESWTFHPLPHGRGSPSTVQPPLHQLPAGVKAQAGGRGGGFVVAVGGVWRESGAARGKRDRPVRVRTCADRRAVIRSDQNAVVAVSRKFGQERPDEAL